MEEVEKTEEETYLDRREKYNRLRLSGVNDREAKEMAWPKTAAGVKRNAEEKAAKEAAGGKE